MLAEMLSQRAFRRHMPMKCGAGRCHLDDMRSNAAVFDPVEDRSSSIGLISHVQALKSISDE